jgi:hypothetical protein
MGVGHQPRFIEDGCMQSVTFRTVGGLHLLRPSQAINMMILGVLGRALALYDVVLHAFVFMSNHGHLLATPRNGEEMSRFVGHVLGNVARGVLREITWSGHVWADRASIVPVIDARAQEERLAYVLAHGAKERLVESPLDWPGVTSARALVGEEELVGEWVDGREACEARRRKRPTDPSDYTTYYPIELAPLPAWARESRAELQRRCREMIEDAEQEVVEAGGRVVGAEAILESSPFERSPEPERYQNLRCHAVCPIQKAAFRQRHAAFMKAQRECSLRRRQELDPDFPDRSFPVAPRFVIHPRSDAHARATPHGLSAVARPPPQRPPPPRAPPRRLR